MGGYSTTSLSLVRNRRCPRNVVWELTALGLMGDWRLSSILCSTRPSYASLYANRESAASTGSTAPKLIPGLRFEVLLGSMG